MRVYVSSSDSKHIYPTNKATNFRVQLPQHIEGSWMCGVAYCLLPFRPDTPVFITCDFIESTILGGQFQPVLCVVTSKSKEYQHIDYVRVKSKQLNSLCVKLVDREGKVVNDIDGETLVVFDFQPSS